MNIFRQGSFDHQKRR